MKAEGRLRTGRYSRIPPGQAKGDLYVRFAGKTGLHQMSVSPFVDDGNFSLHGSESASTQGARLFAPGLASATSQNHNPNTEPDEKQSMADITREELDAKLDRTESRVDAAIARLESQFGGLRGEIGELQGEMRAEARHNSRLHQITWAVMSIFAVLVIGGAGFVVDSMNTRMDRIERQVDALPGELRGIADSITGAVTATQSGQPPVVVIERPATEPAPPEE